MQRRVNQKLLHNGKGPVGNSPENSSEFSFQRYKHSLHQFLTILLLAYVFINRGIESLQFDMEIVDSTTESKPQQTSDRIVVKEHRETKHGDGCYHVFLDVGANIGVHGRFLLEPEKYPKSRSSVALFAKEYPDLDNQDVCVFAFEANPKHWPRLRKVSEAYAAMGWRYHIVEAAVSDQAGKMTFFHQGQEDAKNEEWGFGGAKDLSSIYSKQASQGKYTEEVVTIRLSDWIKTHIGDRLVPEIPPSRKSSDNNNSTAEVIPPPILGMKMDIEGSEYIVIPDLINSGVTCFFTFIFGEYHPRFAPITRFREDRDKNNKTTDFDGFHRVKLETKKELVEYQWALTTTMEAARHCKVRWLNSDDESYLHDGQPFPKPS